MKFCTEPFLVGLEHELPSDSGVVYLGGEPRFGCNQLVCATCRWLPRHVDARSTRGPTPSEAELKDLIASSDATSSSLFDASPQSARSRAYFCRCSWRTVEGIESATTGPTKWYCGGHVTPTPISLYIAKGPRALQLVETVDAVAPELVMVLRRFARWLDPTFPQEPGEPCLGEKGQWTSDGIVTLFTQVDELNALGLGVRIIRKLSYKHRYSDDDEFEENKQGSVAVHAIGLPNGGELSINWKLIVNGREVRGTSAELWIDGPNVEACVADFRDVFDVPTS